MRKLPLRLDQIPFYDTQYMVDPANSMSRQVYNSATPMMDDEEQWDSPLQRNPSMTSQLLTYNAYKKEQACQTNWDRMGESDVIYNQNFHRDPYIMKRYSFSKFNFNKKLIKLFLFSISEIKCKCK